MHVKASRIFDEPGIPVPIDMHMVVVKGVRALKKVGLLSGPFKNWVAHMVKDLKVGVEIVVELLLQVLHDVVVTCQSRRSVRTGLIQMRLASVGGRHRGPR